MTHLPQIAAYADQHFRVEKREEDGADGDDGGRPGEGRPGPRGRPHARRRVRHGHEPPARARADHPGAGEVTRRPGPAPLGAPARSGEYNRRVMIDLLLRKVFGSKHERDVKPDAPARRRRQRPRGRDRPVAGRGVPRRARTSSGRSSRTGPSVDEILPETFAMVREVGRRRLGMRHFDVQLMGGMVLHAGKIAEMATGEGKTLVATLPAVLNGLTGRGRAHRDGERLPRPPRRPVDGSHLPPAGPLGVGHPARGLVPLRPEPTCRPTRASWRSGRASGGRPTSPTSPTGRTTSSASTTCATTCASRSTSWSSGSCTTPSSTRSTPS